MNTSTIIAFVIVGLAIALRADWRPSRPGVNWVWTLGILAVILLLFGVIAGVRGCNNQPKRITINTPPKPVEMVEAFVFREGCLTPCSVNINYRFRICWGERRPLQIHFPGLEPIELPGEGAFKAPSNFPSGEVKFISADLENLHFRVQVFQVTTIPKP